MPSHVILYDLPSKQGTSWSLNPWKTRIILNYKSIPYITQWVEYPDLAPTLSSLGIPPNPSDQNPVRYSSPAITHSNSTHEMDSWAIAHTIEQLHPTPSLHLNDPVNVQVRDLVTSLSNPLRPFIIPKVPAILNPRSASYFLETREVRFGKPLSRVFAEDATERCWEEAGFAATELAKLLKVDASGPFFLGKKVSYADFILVAYFKFLERVDREAYERVVGLDEGFKRVYEACKDWLDMDN
ncbi:hypothetical protein P171DRAFT_408053 [Karstenula rhodostoma CBS 690.94]|uniref:GST N-terminal domain-containing protein n=1 Tax=Karstenula rhodostoma CBS 690.94 TaxID=1392251 RepID=A0A9P4PRR6_9PLEO|nr:hypothetical protein P171DRAFT_408053 [Karstenula rhodostoma CBS 690.94]